MPTNASILLIRHAEKPGDPDTDTGTDTGLAPAGQARAQAYVAYFQNYSIGGSPFKPQYIFATADSDNSHRPRLTVTPLAQALGLTIDDKHADKDYQQVADDLLNHPRYNGSNVLVCWHHGHILQLAAALGVPATPPPSANWPAKWPGHVFGWVLQLGYGADGQVPSQVLCLNEELMYDDYGQQPPDPPSPGTSGASPAPAASGAA